MLQQCEQPRVMLLQVVLLHKGWGLHLPVFENKMPMSYNVRCIL